METFTYSHFDRHHSAVHVALFLDVSNAKDLRARIVNASTLAGDAGGVERETVNFAFIDARLVSLLTAHILRIILNESTSFEDHQPPASTHSYLSGAPLSSSRRLTH